MPGCQLPPQMPASHIFRNAPVTIVQDCFTVPGCDPVNEPRCFQHGSDRWRWGRPCCISLTNCTRGNVMTGQKLVFWPRRELQAPASVHPAPMIAIIRDGSAVETSTASCGTGPGFELRLWSTPYYGPSALEPLQSGRTVPRTRRDAGVYGCMLFSAVESHRSDGIYRSSPNVKTKNCQWLANQ